MRKITHDCIANKFDHVHFAILQFISSKSPFMLLCENKNNQLTVYNADDVIFPKLTGELQSK